MSLQNRVGLRVLKVALVVDPYGVLTAFGLAPANSDERRIGETSIASDGHEAYLADKGFSSLVWENSQLKDLFALERYRARTLGGLLARLATKVAAYTCGQ